MIYTQEEFRPIPQYPVYPPYHKGDYLEDYFYNRFVRENPSVVRNYIGISWTTVYCDGKRNGLQQYLNSIPRDGKYFTVCQHDDAPQEFLPEDTICFSAGGNVRTPNTVPIPLVCYKMPVELPEIMNKPILASFVGSTTHPIRIKMIESCRSNLDIHMYVKHWTPSVDKKEFETFVNITANSKFCLCPRGYGLNSFRIYEAMQLQSIPVIITDDFYLPWQDELNWEEFAVLISEEQIPHISDILSQISEDSIELMKNKLKKVYFEYFCLDGVYNNIIKRMS
jgi:hypothetical protein